MTLFESLQRIDFTAVGSTNLLPLDISKAIIKEKLSVLILSSILSNPNASPDLSYSEFHHSDIHPLPGKEASDYPRLFFFVQKYDKKYGVSLDDPECLGFTKIQEARPYARDMYINIKPDAEIEEVSLFDATRNIEDSTEQQRIEEFFSYFWNMGNIGNTDDRGDDAFSSYKVSFNTLRITDDLQKAAKAGIDDFESFQSQLAKWYKSGFPRHFKRFKTEIGRDDGLPHPHEEKNDFNTIPTPVFYEPIGPMAYDVCVYHTKPQTRLQRLFFNDGCGLREALIPTVHITGHNNGHIAMTTVPNQEMLPLWNAERIGSKKTDTVVLCGCIQDAEALQRANKDMDNVAFTGILGDKLERVDFSPLSKKNVAFLISNHNGCSLEDAYKETEKLFSFLREHIEVKDYAFVQRQVNYPDSTSTIATPRALASTYYHHGPEVVPESQLLPMDEYEFNATLAKIEQRAVPFWIKPADAQREKESRVDDFLVRGILYKGVTTLFAGKSGTKKTHFALLLGRYVVAGDKPFFKERFWTRAKPEGYPKKVVYWCFDDISERELRKMNLIYKKDLPQKFADNFFIESAPESVLNPSVKNIQKEMMKYAFKGQLGLPVELLIIDTLSDLKGQEHSVDSLKLLADFKRLVMPDLAILVLHHITDRGGIRGGSGIKRGPRIAMSLKRDKDDTDVFNLTYADSTNASLAPVEKKPFSFKFDELGVKEHNPTHTRAEMRQKLAQYYKNDDYNHYTNDEIGVLLGYTGRTIQTEAKSSDQKAMDPSDTSVPSPEQASDDAAEQAQEKVNAEKKSSSKRKKRSKK